MRYCSRCHSAYEQDERFCPVDGGVIVAEDRIPSDALIGRTLAGRYLLMDTIGRGGMGVVYEAEHVGLGKRVAVKLLLDTFSEDREVLARFHMEARTASRIGHENIIDILDIGEHEGRTFIVMERLFGNDLRRVCRDAGALPIPRAVGILRQVCEALQAAHDKDIVHRDMKPENVFLARRHGHDDFVKLMDFGISKIIAARDSQVRLTQTGAVIGTPLYMAPEQALGRTDIDHRVDIYAVGVMTYELLVGEPPFKATTYMGLMQQHLSEKPPHPRKLRPELPAALEKVILRSLEKDPRDRWQNMREMADALPDVSGIPDTPGPRAPVVNSQARTGVYQGRAARWRNALFIAGGLAVAVGGVFAAKKVLESRGVSDGSATKGPPVGEGTSSTPAPASQQPQVTPLGASLSQAAPAAPTLDLDSQPSGARVLLDGVDKGTTPVLIVKVTPGIHTLELQLAGYVPVKVQKDVQGPIAENFILTRMPGGKPVTSAVKSRPAVAVPASTPASTPATSAAAVKKPVDPPPSEPASSSEDHKPSPYK